MSPLSERRRQRAEDRSMFAPAAVRDESFREKPLMRLDRFAAGEQARTRREEEPRRADARGKRKPDAILSTRRQ